MKKMILFLIAMCMVLILTGCDGSGAGSGVGDNYSALIKKSSGAKFTVTNSVPDPENLKVIKGKGIEFTVGGSKSHVYKTIIFDSATLDKSGKFTATVDFAVPYLKQKYNDSGTWSRSGQTITIKAKTQGTWTATLSADGKTLEDTGAEPGITARLIYTKQ